MQIAPDGTVVSTDTIYVGPPVQGPSPVPVITTETIIEPIVTGTVPNTLGQTYAIAVLDEGTLVTPKATILNFVGNGVTASTSGSGGNVTITIETLGPDLDTVVEGGQSISVVYVGNVATVTNTFTERVYSGGPWSGTVTPNRSNGTVQKWTLVGDITLNAPINMSTGQSMTLILSQDGTGNRVLTPNAAYLFASAFNTLSTAAGAIDMLNIFYDGTEYYCTLTVGYV